MPALTPTQSAQSDRATNHPHHNRRRNRVVGDFQATIGNSITSVCWEVATFWIKVAFNGLVRPMHERKVWQQRMSDAQSYSEWATAASRLDQLEGKTEWKYRLRRNGEDFDCELVQSRLEQLQRALESGDEAAIAFLLRTSLARNFGGIDNSRLYEHCRVGTKTLVEEFTNEIVQLLNLLAASIGPDTSPMELKRRMDLFRELRHSLGNTALLLSGGGSLGVYHIGVLKALWESGLLPRIIAGSSSGSIMAAVACCHTDEEIPKRLQLEGVSLNMLEENVPVDQQGSWMYPLTRKLSRFITHGVVFDASVLRTSMRDTIGDITFLEAYRKTNRVLNIAVSSTTMYDMPRLLNYITAPNVLIWSAVVASCAVPALYESAPLLARDHRGEIVPWNVTGDRWCDGSLENDLPMERLAEIFNVNHFIVSQVNPHIYPFVKHAVKSSSRFRSLNHKIMFLVRSELNYRLDQISDLGICPKFCQMLKSVLSQKYYGDITIVPELAWSDIAHMFVDRPAEAIMKAIHRGEVATWPKISLIRSQLQAELTLDEILLSIRDRILASTGALNDVQPSSETSNHSTCKITSEVSEETPDPMFDPTVDIRRHLSPSLLSMQTTRSLTPLAQTAQINGTGRLGYSVDSMRPIDGEMFHFQKLPITEENGTTSGCSSSNNNNNNNSNSSIHLRDRAFTE